MVDIVSGAVSGATTLTANSTAGGPAPLAAANEADAARFSSLMSQPLPPADEVGPIGAVAGPTATGKGTLGDAMLDSLSSVGDRYRSVKADMFEATNFNSKDSVMGLTDLLRLQVRLADMSLHVELISKGVAKVDQHVDQLTKLQ